MYTSQHNPQVRTSFMRRFGTLMASLITAFLVGHAPQAMAQCSIATCQQPVTVGAFNVGAQVLATANYNDWFKSGSTQGVIAFDANTQAFINALNSSGHNNLTYEQRMSVPFATTVVVGGQPVLMLDAVAARDNHSAGSQVDSTVFGSGADKNAANPGTWTLGISSVPQKNDIIDVGGHIRRTDDGTGNDALMGYAYATTRNTSGTSYLDFEIFRTFPKLIGGQLTYNNGLPGAGPDGGHTASILDCNPANFRPGDLIVSIDYTNGGANACVSVYVWINPNNVDGAGHNLAWYNTQACRRFNFTGVFHTGTGAGQFGYAEITPLNASAAACLVRAVANTAAGVQAGPWGNLSAQNAAFQTTYEPLQLIEVSINFSALGLDIAPTLGPCVNLFGSLAVKTRSSASFTSELKDWTGPYLFGAFAELNADAGMDKNLSCTYPTATLCASSTNPNATFVWKTIPSLTQIASTQCVTVNQPGCYIVIATDNNLQTCSDTDTVCVTSVIDSIPPDVTCPPNLTISCNNLIPDGATSYQEFISQGGSIFDISGNLTVSFTDSPLNIGNCGATLTREYTVTDTCDNVGGCTQLITVNDTVNPIITGPANVTLGCNPVIPAPNTALVTATDNCTTPVVSVLPDVVSGTCQRTTTRTYRATDACGNFTDFVQTFTYKFDTIAPVITPDNVNLNLGCNPTPAQIENALGSATVTDNCDNLTVNTTTDPVQQNGCNRSQTRRWNVADQCGNNATERSVTITWKSDLTAPVITLNGTQGANPNLGCNPSAAQIEAALGTASASDNCDNVTANPTDGNIVSNGCFRTQTRTWNATDICGNNATAVVRTVTWKVDTDAPVITLSGTQGANPDLGCNPTAAEIEAALGTATASDNCDNVTANPTTSTVTNNGCFRTQTRTWNAVDQCGNNAAAVVRTVTWKVDLTAPVITLDGTQGANPNLGCNPTAAQIEAALGTASASDNCDNVTANPTTSTVSSNGCFRTQTRTWNATDDCGNNAVAVVRTVTWKVDLTAPVIALSGTQGANPDLGCNPTVAQIEAALGTATASDNCDNVTANPTTSIVTNNGCFRTQTRTWNAVDQCGNNAIAVVRTVTWKVDLTAPVITLEGTQGANPNLGCNPTAAQIEAALGTASASDNCDNVTANPTTSTVSNNGCSRTQTRTWNAVDQCGNNAVAVVRTVTWKVDLTAPVITPANANSNLGCNPTAAQIEAALGTASVTDNCDNLTVNATTDPVQQNGCGRTQTRRWNATDLCGNNAVEKSVTVSWKVDTEAPVITTSGPVADSTNLGCNPTAAQIDAALGTASATDNCDNSVNVQAATSGEIIDGCTRWKVRTWNAEDLCGNDAIAVTRTIFWTLDTVAPTLNCPADTTIIAPGSSATGPCVDLGGGGLATYTGSTRKTRHSKVGIDFRQPRNEEHPVQPLLWTNGVNNRTQAEYHEGMGVPQRVILTELEGTTHTMKFRHEAVKRQAEDVHAYDFMMSWNQAIATAGNIGNGSRNELDNLLAQECNNGISWPALNACNSFGHSATATLPDNMGNPPNHHGIRGVNDVIAAFEAVYGDRSIEIEANAPISGVSITFDGYSGSATGDNYAWYTLTWNSTASSVMVKMAGRLAASDGPSGYGSCYGAASINGAPYHFKLDLLDNYSMGNRDNQVMAEQKCDQNIPVTFGEPSATDECGEVEIVITGNDTVYFDTTGAKVHCRTWSATDECGNVSQCTQCISVVCGSDSAPLDTTSSTSTGRLSSEETSTTVDVYPNPAKQNAFLEFSLNGYSSNVTIELFTITGDRVMQLFNAYVDSDRTQKVTFDVSSLPSGLYLYRMTTSEGILTDKVTVVR